MTKDFFPPGTILIKTEKGISALQDRASLSSRLRLVLIMVDGTTPAKVQQQKVAALGAPENALMLLFEQELISVSVEGITSPAPAVAAAAVVAAPAVEPAASEPDSRTLTEAKSLLRYCIRNCAGNMHAKSLNAALDNAHGPQAILEFSSQLSERVQGPMVERTQERVNALLGGGARSNR
jgi:hypothetical protein